MKKQESKATRSDPGRAVAFSDAIIAIVITLLVLDLRPPKSEPGELLAGLLGKIQKETKKIYNIYSH